MEGLQNHRRISHATIFTPPVYSEVRQTLTLLLHRVRPYPTLSHAFYFHATLPRRLLNLVPAELMNATMFYQAIK